MAFFAKVAARRDVARLHRRGRSHPLGDQDRPPPHGHVDHRFQRGDGRLRADVVAGGPWFSSTPSPTHRSPAGRPGHRVESRSLESQDRGWIYLAAPRGEVTMQQSPQQPTRRRPPRAGSRCRRRPPPVQGFPRPPSRLQRASGRVTQDAPGYQAWLWSDPRSWPDGRVPGTNDVAVIRRPIVLDKEVAVRGVQVDPDGAGLRAAGQRPAQQLGQRGRPGPVDHAPDLGRIRHTLRLSTSTNPGSSAAA